MSLPNWFAPTERPSFVRFTEEFVGRDHVHALQLGAFAGDVTCWLLEHVLTGMGSSIDDVDTWGGSTNADERGLDFATVEARYDLRTASFSADGRLRKWKCASAAFFAALPEDRTYDLIVVDADHHAASVLEDAIAAFHHLAPNGVMLLNHYTWTSPEGLFASPRIGIDAFCAVYANHLEVLERGTGVWLRRRGGGDLKLVVGGDPAAVG